MHNEITHLVEKFETGKITRRQLVARLGTLVAVLSGAGKVLGQEKPPSTFEAVGLNHIALRVPDVPRSRDFYRKHLGLTIARDGGENNCFLNCGDNFVALFRGDEPRMDHYCYSVKNYDVRMAEEKLRAEGLEPDVQGQRIYFRDPDGLRVQLASENHRPE